MRYPGTVNATQHFVEQCERQANTLWQAIRGCNRPEHPLQIVPRVKRRLRCGGKKVGNSIEQRSIGIQIKSTDLQWPIDSQVDHPDVPSFDHAIETTPIRPGLSSQYPAHAKQPVVST